MKPFNLKKAISGEKIIDRSGREIKEIHWFKGIDQNKQCVVVNHDGDIFTYFIDGVFMCDKEPSNLDLFMDGGKK